MLNKSLLHSFGGGLSPGLDIHHFEGVIEFAFRLKNLCAFFIPISCI
jgi:hypothetical protein